MSDGERIARVDRRARLEHLRGGLRETEHAALGVVDDDRVSADEERVVDAAPCFALERIGGVA